MEGLVIDTVGVFFCSGCGIGDTIDMEALDGVATEAGAATTLTHPCLCEEAGVKAIRDAVAEHSLDGVVVAACSERSKREVF